MATPRPILKKSTQPQSGPAAQANGSRYTDRHREIAVYHATLLQQQKDVESKILESLEELIDFPEDGESNAARPSTKEVARFSALVAPFQVSDYDSLIEERNAVKKCGYVFCPRSTSTARYGSASSVILKASNGRSIDVISKEKASMFCDMMCAKRAMFIKVQLSETPAWERAGGLGKAIEILPETEEEALENGLRTLRLDNLKGDELERAMKELALERGKRASSAKKQLVMTGEIQEKRLSNTGKANPPSPTQATEAIEGYVPLNKRT